MALHQSVERAFAPGTVEFVDPHRLAVALTGDSLMANVLLLGSAWQRGLLPVSEAPDEHAGLRRPGRQPRRI